MLHLTEVFFPGGGGPSPPFCRAPFVSREVVIRLLEVDPNLAKAHYRLSAKMDEVTPSPPPGAAKNCPILAPPRWSQHGLWLRWEGGRKPRPPLEALLQPHPSLPPFAAQPFC